MKNKLNCLKIEEITLNPTFCSDECYESLKNQGFTVRWMTENDPNIKSMYAIIVEEND